MSGQKALILETIKEFKKTEEKSRKNRAYHNVRLLMKNYNILKQHADNAVYKLDDECRELYFQDAAEETYIKSILRTKIRTAIMVQHIDMALDALKEDCMLKGNRQQFDVLYDFFIVELMVEDMAVKYSCSVVSIHRWKNEMLRELGVLLFGSDGLL